MNSINMNTIDFNGGAGGSVVFPSKLDFPLVGQEGMIYIDSNTNIMYRFDATTQSYVGLNGSPRNPVPGPETDEGVYIKYTDGSISAPDVLIEGKTAVGVAYYSNNLKLVMHPQQVGKMSWQAGKDACVNMIFADGSEGRMPTQVELNAFCVNRTQVDIALTTIGGDIFNTDYTWSSTERDSNSAYNVSYTNWSLYSKMSNYFVRAVCDF